MPDRSWEVWSEAEDETINLRFYGEVEGQECAVQLGLTEQQAVDLAHALLRATQTEAEA